jgi:predicted acyl esterase
MSFRHPSCTLLLIAIAACPFPAAPQQSGDIPKSFTVPTAANDYVRREVMIPMRDGVKLYTVMLIPKGASNAPIVLTRTPYNASLEPTATSASFKTFAANINPKANTS